MGSHYHQLKLVANGESAEADNRTTEAAIWTRIIFRCHAPCHTAKPGSCFGPRCYWRPTLHLVSVFYEGGQVFNDAVRSTIGVLGWRVELRPQTPAQTVEFLHVLQVGPTGQAPDAIRDATHQLTAETSTVTFQQASRRFVLTLNRTGQRGGAIAVEDSRTNVRQSLPEDIEAHWRYFQDNPHFQLWETDARYRVVIGTQWTTNGQRSQ